MGVLIFYASRYYFHMRNLVDFTMLAASSSSALR
jgi:hypothetical protein